MPIFIPLSRRFPVLRGLAWSLDGKEKRTEGGDALCP